MPYKDREKQREYDKKRRQKNKKKIKLQQKEWRRKNKEKIREHRQKNKEYYKKYGKEWRAKNKVKRKQYLKDYCKENRENLKQQQREYNERLKRQIDQILGTKCVICGRTENLICHEIHGKKHSTSKSYIINHSDDFVKMCRLCHKFIHIISKQDMNFEKLFRLILLLTRNSNNSLYITKLLKLAEMN